MKAKALMGVVAAGTLVATSAHATPPSPPPALTVEVLARSVVPDSLNINTTFSDGTKIRLKTNGPLDLVTSRTTLAPGATTGWHRHGAVVLLSVTSGQVTEYREHRAHCVATTYTSGEAIVEDGKHPHVVVNESDQPATWVITLLVPQGSPSARIDAPAPAACPDIG